MKLETNVKSLLPSSHSISETDQEFKSLLFLSNLGGTIGKSCCHNVKLKTAMTRVLKESRVLFCTLAREGSKPRIPAKNVINI